MDPLGNAIYFTICMPKRTIKTTLDSQTSPALKTRPKKVATIRKYCMFEGRFNMLKAGVTYIKQTQVFGLGGGRISGPEGYRMSYRFIGKFGKASAHAT